MDVKLMMNDDEMMNAEEVSILQCLLYSKLVGDFVWKGIPPPKTCPNGDSST